MNVTMTIATHKVGHHQQLIRYQVSHSKGLNSGSFEHRAL